MFISGSHLLINENKVSQMNETYNEYSKFNKNEIHENI